MNINFPAAVACVVAIVTGPTFADGGSTTAFWLQAQSGSLTNASNWSASLTPETDAIIDVEGSPFEVNFMQSISLSSFTLSSPSAGFVGRGGVLRATKSITFNAGFHEANGTDFIAESFEVGPDADFEYIAPASTFPALLGSTQIEINGRLTNRGVHNLPLNGLLTGNGTFRTISGITLLNMGSDFNGQFTVAPNGRTLLLRNPGGSPMFDFGPDSNLSVRGLLCVEHSTMLRGGLSGDGTIIVEEGGFMSVAEGFVYDGEFTVFTRQHTSDPTSYLELGDSTEISVLSLEFSEVRGAGDLTVRDRFIPRPGTLAGTGQFQMTPGAVIEYSMGVSGSGGLTLARPWTLNNDLTIEGGPGFLTVDSGGFFLIGEGATLTSLAENAILVRGGGAFVLNGTWDTRTSPSLLPRIENDATSPGTVFIDGTLRVQGDPEGPGRNDFGFYGPMTIAGVVLLDDVTQLEVQGAPVFLSSSTLTGTPNITVAHVPFVESGPRALFGGVVETEGLLLIRGRLEIDLESSISVGSLRMFSSALTSGAEPIIESELIVGVDPHSPTDETAPIESLGTAELSGSLFIQFESSQIEAGSVYPLLHAVGGIVGSFDRVMALNLSSELAVELLRTDDTLSIAVGLACPGDCDQNGTVDFNDLVAMLFEFGNQTQSCDTNLDGAVTFDDIVATLFLFGPCEP